MHRNIVGLLERQLDGLKVLQKDRLHRLGLREPDFERPPGSWTGDAPHPVHWKGELESEDTFNSSQFNSSYIPD